MIQKNKQITINKIITEAKKRDGKIDTKLINQAYKYALKKHEDQFRKSGEPYIIHPLNVAYIVATFGLDEATICAALLHDIVEDTDVTRKDIVKIFGIEIAQIVDGVTKLSEFFKTTEDKQAHNYKKMFMAIEKDVRVILLKLADRLHNIRTLEYLKRDRQIAIAKETIEVYAPIANKLGMYSVKCELEDESFRFLYPEKYKQLAKEIQETIGKKYDNLKKTSQNIKQMLKKQRIQSIITFEPKHIYNIYKKIIYKKQTIEEINDLFSMRILVKNKKECYIVMGLISEMYSCFSKTFKDFIAMPKLNTYKALHEIMIGENGTLVELQITTYEMNRFAKNGIVEYLEYAKKNKDKADTKKEYEKNLNWLYDCIEAQDLIEDSNEILGVLRDELYEDEVYAFTEDGEIKIFPKGATIIDFAYGVSSEKGNHLNSCKINGEIKNIENEIHTGDIIEINIEKDINVKEEWLNYVKTAKARAQIIRALKTNKRNIDKKRIELRIITQNRKKTLTNLTQIINNMENLELEKFIFQKRYNGEKDNEYKFILVTSKECEFEGLIEEIKKIESINEE